METRILENFIIVCKELHFTRAAEIIGIAQPTLSQQIRALEDEFDVPLFDRVGKKIMLTQAGALLLEYSVQMVRHMANAQDAIAQFRTGQRGTLVIGVLPSDLDYRITQLLVDFHAIFPKVKLKVLSSIDVLNQVLDNEVDIGIGLSSSPDERLVRVPLSREEYVLVVSKNHDWADRESISIEELRHIQTVMYPQGFTGRELIDNWCRKYGFALDTIMETASATSIVSLVKANIGGTVQPYPLIKAMDEPTLHCIRISDDAPYRSFEIVYRSDRYLGFSAQAFIRQTIEFFK
ncbi:LysR family transcriptional regulator [Paenibacillus sp. N3.4]|uniref:LysR family transcriptional regulator n=1 Tax=Paenibacillus sp. N3.4 TaxID=2603222 RepID=UPI0011C7EE98|nr:LysR family transcriptional regulator [Paenibacillus sp. N3.4]TXK71921.1 LysR family transcriptional regulator [Paenibacillus sp. N3.4]